MNRPIAVDYQSMARGLPVRRDALVGQATAAETGVNQALLTTMSLLSVAGAGSGAYHGYKRHHDSIGWALIWALLGGIAPVITIPVSLAQGFGKPGR